MARIDADQHVQPGTSAQPVTPVGEASSDAKNDHVPRPLGLREVSLTVEDAENIRQLLDDPQHPSQTGREVEQLGPASLLNKK